jgi:hypothetical protein
MDSFLPPIRVCKDLMSINPEDVIVEVKIDCLLDGYVEKILSKIKKYIKSCLELPRLFSRLGELIDLGLISTCVKRLNDKRFDPDR